MEGRTTTHTKNAAYMNIYKHALSINT